MSKPARYWSTRRAAAELGCSYQQIMAAIERGELPIAVEILSPGERTTVGLDPEDVRRFKPRGVGRPSA